MSIRTLVLGAFPLIVYAVGGYQVYTETKGVACQTPCFDVFWYGLVEPPFAFWDMVVASHIGVQVVVVALVVLWATTVIQSLGHPV